MKKGKKILTASMAIVTALSLAACGGSSSGAGKDSGSSEKASGTLEFDKPGTIKAYFFNEGKNMDKVIKKFEEETKDTLNTKIDFNWTTDHKQEMPLKFTAKEQVDLTFDAYWQNLAKNKSDGVYADLSSYFENDAYPGLKSAFSSELLDLVREEDGAIYSIPLVGINGGNQAQGFMINGKLREKYNLPEVTNDETFKQYLDTMYENADKEGLTSVMSMWGIGWNGYLGKMNERLANNIVSVSGFEVQISDDGTKVEGVLGLGDDASAAENFHGEFQGKNYLYERNKLLADEYGKYVDENALSSEASATAKTAAQYCFLTEWPGKKADAEAAGEDPELYIFNKEMNEGTGTVYNDMTTANNFMVVPSYSKNIDRTMAFLNWVFSSQENWNLWSYGIEGEDFEVSEENDKVITPLSPADKYSFPMYEMTENTNYTRIDSSIGDYATKMYEFCLDESNFEQNVLAGFSFDAGTTPALKQAFASYNTTSGDYQGYFACGLYKDKFEEKYAEYQEKTEKDAKVVKEELQKQVQAFLDAKNK